MLSEDFFMTVTIRFKSLIDSYRLRLENEDNPIVISHLNNILDYANKNAFLETGFTVDKLQDYKNEVQIILGDLFPGALTLNEIKAATVPFSDVLFNETDRLKNILSHAGEDFNILKFSDFDTFTMACGVILSEVYGRNIDMSRPMHTRIPDENGKMHTYRITYNADFLDVDILDETDRLNDDQIEQLLREPDNLALWQSSFPSNIYNFTGFGIISLVDVTVDTSIADLKTFLLNGAISKQTSSDQLAIIFQRLFNVDNLQVGFTLYEPIDRYFEKLDFDFTKSFLLGKELDKSTKEILCEESHQCFLKEFRTLVITDVDAYLESINNPYIPQTLKDAGMQSAILHPLSDNGKLLGILELVSPTPFALNKFNAIKLDEISEYVAVALRRSVNEFKNQIKAIIQSECTSIHPSVAWKFEQQARKLIKRRREHRDFTFNDIIFSDVYPLYGQIDIVGSSSSRNEAVRKDLIEQLQRVCDIFAFAKANQALPIYDQITHRLLSYLDSLQENEIDANTENNIAKILSIEVNPVMSHIRTLSDRLAFMVDKYVGDLDDFHGVIYKNRNTYDVALQKINDSTTAFLDSKQEEAQKIYPHYFERFKTDGVEHNIYVGESISQFDDYNVVYLQNLRLWQLQTMIEMEHKFYEVQKDAEHKLEAASMILVFGNTLSIRYRIDEKRFDVDGAYNARYEVVKKRIDKACIKGTEQRVTQKGKIAIVYTNEETELEYTRYIHFLQRENFLENNIETVFLEDVQGVSGLKALRVNILYPVADNKAIPLHDYLVEA